MRIFIFLFFILIFTSVRGDHIVGGDAIYRCLGVNDEAETITIEAKFTIYRNSFGTYFDFGSSFGVYLKNGDDWIFYREISNIDPTDIEDITEVGDNPCLVVPPNIRIEKADYIFELTLPWADVEYMIVYQKCCRTGSINNIVSPEETGAAFSFTIHPESQRTCNNSPVFNDFPPIVICLGEEVDFDHSASDPEGDELVYSFCAPLNAGGPVGLPGYPGDESGCNGNTPDPMECLPPYEEVVFNTPTYNASNPLGGDPQITIDPSTGLITGVPNVEGQFVVGVCIEEIRNGVVLNRIRRDFQFNVVQCDRVVIADLAEEEIKDGRSYFSSCGESEISFENLSTQEENIEGYSWQFINDTSLITSTEVSPTIYFPSFGTYEGMLIANPGSNCGDTAFITVDIFEEGEADFSFDYDTCVAGPITLQGSHLSGASIAEWTWEVDGVDTIIGSDQITYNLPEPGTIPITLRVEDVNGCVREVSREVDYAPVPNLILVEPNSFISCLPASIVFDNLSVPIDTNYQVMWNFGDGGTSMDISPTYTYTEPGKYDVAIDIISPVGCQARRVFPQLIEVLPSPLADFTYSPEKPSLANNRVEFFDESIDAVSWQWIFDTVGIALQPNPEFLFPDTGLYLVELIVANEFSCTDTMRTAIDIEPLSTLFLPNAFTPNNDGTNDEFIGVGIRSGLSDYNMSVYNRYGEMVFSSSVPNRGWNGRKNNSGENAPTGIYVYTVKYTDSRGDQVVKKGYVTLLR